MFHDGRGVPQDLAEAARHWRQAADKGYAKAEAALASAYMFGRGVEKDYDTALRLARRAADKGNAHGELYLGELHARGWGVPQDSREGVRWLVKAASHDDNDDDDDEVLLHNLRELAAEGLAEATEALRRCGLAP
jgi:TPR repeat protein